jgi:hypothetical protein
MKQNIEKHIAKRLVITFPFLQVIRSLIRYFEKYGMWQRRCVTFLEQFTTVLKNNTFRDSSQLKLLFVDSFWQMAFVQPLKIL